MCASWAFYFEVSCRLTGRCAVLWPATELLQMQRRICTTKVTILMTLMLTASTGLALAAGDAAAGKAVYDKACKTCHGADGTPNPAIAKMMKVDMKPLGGAEVQG